MWYIVAGIGAVAIAALEWARKGNPIPGPDAPTWQDTGSNPGETAVDVALQWLNTPYQFGGTSPGTGLDCSGLTFCAYGEAGVTLPRTAAEQYAASVPVKTPKKGDLGFYSDTSGQIVHVVMNTGNGQIEAGRYGTVVGPTRENRTPDHTGETFLGWRRPS